LFILFVLPPPFPPFFSYTTLFRSKTKRIGWYVRCLRLVRCHGTCHVRSELTTSLPFLCSDYRNSDRRCLYHNGECPSFLCWYWRDRKSTRLNSSHVSISYAVFCLQ